MKAWLQRRDKLGLIFVAFAVIVTFLSYTFINQLPYWADTILLFTGFATPLFGAMIGKGYGGCGIKDIDCGPLATNLGFLGFIIGLLLLLLVYYWLGCLVSFVIKKLRTNSPT